MHWYSTIVMRGLLQGNVEILAKPFIEIPKKTRKTWNLKQKLSQDIRNR